MVGFIQPIIDSRCRGPQNSRYVGSVLDTQVMQVIRKKGTEISLGEVVLGVDNLQPCSESHPEFLSGRQVAVLLH